MTVKTACKVFSSKNIQYSSGHHDITAGIALIIRTSHSQRIERMTTSLGNTLIRKQYFQSAGIPREVLFYQAIRGNQLPLTKQIGWRCCHVLHCDQHDGRVTIDMEDVQASGFSNFTMSSIHLILATDSIANLTAWLNEQDASTYPLNYLDDISMHFADRLWQFFDSSLLERYLPETVLQGLIIELTGLVKALPSLQERCAEMPVGFAHNDLNHGNLLIHERQQEVVILDWQTYGFALVGSDLAQFFMPSFWTSQRDYYTNPEQFKQLELQMLNRYYQSLQQQEYFRGHVTREKVEFGYRMRVICHVLLNLLPRYLDAVARGKAKLISEAEFQQKLAVLQEHIRWIQAYLK